MLNFVRSPPGTEMRHNWLGVPVSSACAMSSVWSSNHARPSGTSPRVLITCDWPLRHFEHANRRCRGRPRRSARTSRCGGRRATTPARTWSRRASRSRTRRPDAIVCTSPPSRSVVTRSCPRPETLGRTNVIRCPSGDQPAGVFARSTICFGVPPRNGTRHRPPAAHEIDEGSIGSDGRAPPAIAPRSGATSLTLLVAAICRSQRLAPVRPDPADRRRTCHQG